MSDMTLVLPTTGARPSLADEVAKAGLPNIPLAQVEAHMRSLVDKDCPRVFDRIMNAASSLSRFLTLRMFVKFLAPNISVFNQELIAICVSALSVIGFLSLEGQYTGAALVALVIVFGWVSQILSITTTRYVYGYARQRVVWEKHTVTSFLAGGESIPKRLLERQETGLQISGAEVKVLAEHSDPFLIIERGFGPWKECVIIGAWDTNTDMDNI